MIAALDVIQSEPELLVNLHRNRKFLCDGLKEMGYKAIDTPSAVTPVIIGHETKAYQLTALLEEMGVYVNAVSRPAVPRDLSRLRVSGMATHTREHLGDALKACKEAGRRLALIP